VALVLGAQLLARLLLRLAWVRAAVDQVREWLGLPPSWASSDQLPEGIPGGPYGWDDEVYSLSETGSSGGGDDGSEAGVVAAAAATARPRRDRRWLSKKAG
jgi:hypothetical protein